MISEATRRKLEITWNYQCAVCSKTDYIEMHHIIPKAEGGTDAEVIKIAGISRNSYYKYKAELKEQQG